jgi:hypothetical protein
MGLPESIITLRNSLIVEEAPVHSGIFRAEVAMSDFNLHCFIIFLFLCFFLAKQNKIPSVTISKIHPSLSLRLAPSAPIHHLNTI